MPELQLLHYKDGQTEIVNDYAKDVIMQIQNVKNYVFLHLSMAEYDKYMKLPVSQREEYVREKYLSTIQK